MEQLVSTLIDDLSVALAPDQLMEHLALKPDGWQRRLLRESPRRALLNMGRQVGKSTTCAVLGLHQALFVPGSLVLILSASLRQAVELYRKLLFFWRRFPAMTQSINESAQRLELSNNSRVVSLPASEATIRGYSACDLLVIDEAARVSDDMITAIRPTLATSNGRLVALSTPAGRRGFFFEQWEHGGPEWSRFTLRSDQCSRISQEFLEEEKRQMGPLLFSQEYECCFISDESALFNSAIIEAALSDEVRPLWQ